MALFISQNEFRLRLKSRQKFEVRPRRGAKFKMADFAMKSVIYFTGTTFGTCPAILAMNQFLWKK
jgi:hypothetical protein